VVREISTLGEGFNTQVVTLWCFNIEHIGARGFDLHLGGGFQHFQVYYIVPLIVVVGSSLGSTLWSMVFQHSEAQRFSLIFTHVHFGAFHALLGSPFSFHFSRHFTRLLPVSPSACSKTFSIADDRSLLADATVL
jgi:hypothetical protein